MTYRDTDINIWNCLLINCYETIYVFNTVASNYEKKIEFPVGKKENFAGPQVYSLEARKERSCQSYSYITGNEERGARFITQPLSALY